MLRSDLEKFVCVVSCETLVDAAGGGERRPNQPPAAVEDPDILAESSNHVIGWADRNAVYDRNDSTTGSTNPKSSNASRRGPAASNSQLFSTNPKAKAPIIGLPGKIQHSGFDGRNARRPPRVRIFPKKVRMAEGGGRGKSAVPESEPGSPKVSCFGKVLSDRERERRRREGQRAAEGEWDGWRCSAGFVAIFRCGGGGQTAEEEVEKKITVPPRNIPALAGSVPESPADAPVLGEMRRFVSGRRAASWGAEAEAEAGAGG
ncbi:hypothetical protein COCNU_02G016640 [Cocos nucifera]|uniref:Uncharacterized protein n=1 Tax=Cocos nucifera TaxID=13894 RepID=A0A8K0I0G4_COCNU|nr:hypothetical protein COCNU_02G016640 [Cocos nucifera]